MKYGVIHFESIHHEGDERSRTHPGHGYSAYTEQVKKITTFETEEQLKAWIVKHSKENYTPIKYEELKADITLNVKLS